MLHVARHCLAQIYSSTRSPLSPMAACDISESGCSRPIKDYQIGPHSPAVMNCTLDHDWRAAIQSFGWMQASNSLSPCIRCTRPLPSLWYWENLGSSLKIQCFNWRRSQTRCLWSHLQRHRLCNKVKLGHLAGRRHRHRARSRSISVRAVVWLLKRRIICMSDEDKKLNGSSRSTTGSVNPPHPSLALIRSPLLAIAPHDLRILASRLDFSPHQTDNRPVLTTKQFRAKRTPPNFAAHENRQKIVFKRKLKLALGYSPKMTAPGMLLFDWASTHKTQAKSVKTTRKSAR